MKRINFILLIGLALFICNCTNDPDEDNNEYIEYKIQVSGIDLPDTISLADTLVIKFDGEVGTDGCHRFSRFESNINSDEINVTVWGTKPNFATACPAVMVYLNGKEFKSKLPKGGMYKIIIHQPNNSTLTDYVFVK